MQKKKQEEKDTVQAAWWVEYVCRHQGAQWLRGIEEGVPFYQVPCTLLCPTIKCLTILVYKTAKPHS